MSPQARNILRYWRKATPAQKQRGLARYREAHTLCRKLAMVYGLDTMHVAGALAALSPVCSWENNVLSLLSLLKTGHLPPQSTYPKNIEKARRILAGELPSRVLGGNKVRNFYASILRPHSAACCIDRHAAGLATRGRWGGGKPVTPRQYRALLSSYQIAARRARVNLPALQAVTWTVYRDNLRADRKQYGVQTSLYSEVTYA